VEMFSSFDFIRPLLNFEEVSLPSMGRMCHQTIRIYSLFIVTVVREVGLSRGDGQYRPRGSGWVGPAPTAKPKDEHGLHGSNGSDG
jgi:hypothetical protein